MPQAYDVNWDRGGWGQDVGNQLMQAQQIFRQAHAQEQERKRRAEQEQYDRAQKDMDRQRQAAIDERAGKAAEWEMNDSKLKVQAEKLKQATIKHDLATQEAHRQGAEFMANNPEAAQHQAAYAGQGPEPAGPMPEGGFANPPSQVQIPAIPGGEGEPDVVAARTVSPFQMARAAIEAKKAEERRVAEAKRLEQRPTNVPRGGSLIGPTGQIVFQDQRPPTSEGMAGVASTNAITSIDQVPKQYQATVKAMLDYRESPQSIIRGSSRQSDQLRNQLVGWAHDLDSSYDYTQAPARMSLRKEFVSGQSSKNLTALNTAERHLATLEKLSKSLPAGIPFINWAENKASKASGGASVTNFEGAATKVADEVTKAFTGAGAMAEQNIKRELENLSPNMSRSQLDGQIKTVREMLAGRRAELRSTYERGMGKPYDLGEGISAATGIDPEVEKRLKALGY